MFEGFKKDVSRASMKGHGPMSLEQILMDPVNLKYFKAFCISEMSVENLLFWLEVADYKTIEAPEYRKFVAKKICRKYVAAEAPMGISVKDSTRKKVTMPTSTPSLDLFDEIRSEVVLSMKMDILPRFLESTQYHDLVELKFEQRSITWACPRLSRARRQHRSCSAPVTRSIAALATVSAGMPSRLANHATCHAHRT